MIDLLDREDGMSAEERRRLEASLEDLIRQVEGARSFDLPTAPAVTGWSGALVKLLAGSRR